MPRKAKRKLFKILGEHLVFGSARRWTPNHKNIFSPNWFYNNGDVIYVSNSGSIYIHKPGGLDGQGAPIIVAPSWGYGWPREYEMPLDIPQMT